MLPNIIKSLQHPIVKDLVKARKDKQFRYKKNILVISENKIIKEISKSYKIRILLFSSKEPPIIAHQNKIKVTQEIITKISGIKSANNLLAVVDIPKEKDLSLKNHILVLDRLSDPGNVGTLIRTALGLGWEGVIFTPNTTDPFNDKAIRSSRGAVLFLPYQFMTYEKIFNMAKSSKKKILIADTKGKDITSYSFGPKVLLVLSSEAHGPSILAKMGKKITIPMTKKVESLNVAIAGGIIMQKTGPNL